MALISVEQLKRFHKSETTDDEWLYAMAIDAAEQYLRDETGREIHEADTVATARSYRPERGSDVLWIHDCAEITSVVEEGSTLVAGTDYVAEPLNNRSASGAYMPTDRLRRYLASWEYDYQRPTVVVTAKWGWLAASIPVGMQMALYVASKAYLESRDVRQGLVVIENLGVSGERQAKAVWDFINNYRGHGSWGIA